MLKARAATGGAAAIAAVEAELGRGVAALARHGGVGKNLADGVPGTHITHRVGTCGFANRRLVDKHHIAQMVGPQQTVVGASTFGAFAKVAQQSRCQDVLNQGGLARAADAGDGDPALQRKLDVQVLQVVLACAFQNKARRALGHQSFQAHAHLLARTQISTCEGVGLFQVIGRAIKHHLAAALARAGPHVHNAVGRQHDRRVVLDHHQGVARIPQAQHGLGDAVHVTRVQANAGLVQHEQGVHQRRAQGRGQVDALHLTATQGAALAVQAEVANAHIAQVFQAGADFFQQQMQGLLLGLGVRRERGVLCHVLEKVAQTLNRQQHQVVQTQTWQGFQLRTAPSHAMGHEAFGRGHGGVGTGHTANAPQQAVGLQTCPAAVATRRVAAVFGQQHPDVHLVGLGFQVFKETLDPIPLLVPFAIPVGRAVDHPVALAGIELGPRGVTRNACGFGVAHQVVLALLPSRGLHGLDGTAAQSEFVVGNHQAIVHPDHPTKAFALGASTCG